MWPACPSLDPWTKVFFPTKKKIDMISCFLRSKRKVVGERNKKEDYI